MEPTFLSFVPVQSLLHSWIWRWNLTSNLRNVWTTSRRELYDLMFNVYDSSLIAEKKYTYFFQRVVYLWMLLNYRRNLADYIYSENSCHCYGFFFITNVFPNYTSEKVRDCKYTILAERSTVLFILLIAFIKYFSLCQSCMKAESLISIHHLFWEATCFIYYFMKIIGFLHFLFSYNKAAWTDSN